MWIAHKLVLKHIEKLYAIYAKGQRLFFSIHALRPVKIHVVLTYECNCSCRGCDFAANSCRDNFTGNIYKGELSFEAVKNIANQLPKGSFITLSGGEPTLAQDFFKIVEYLTKKHKVQINTNGVNLNRENVRQLVRSGAWIIHLSINSHEEEIHDQFRGHRGLFRRIMESIEEIKRLRNENGSAKPYIHVNQVIQKDDIAHLPETVKLCAKQGVEWLSFAVMRDDRGGLYDYEDEELLLLKDKLKEAAELAKAAQMTLRLGDELKSIDHILKTHAQLTTEGRGKREVDMSPFACYAPWLALWIRPNGDVRICRTLLGNIHNESIKSLWNNKAARNLRRNFFFGEKEKLSEQCHGCCLVARR